MTGCLVTSVHPYYTSKDIFFQPTLLGQWTNTTEAKERWTFEKLGQHSYKLVYVSGGNPATLEVQLFRLGGETFLDLASLEKQCDVAPPPVPSHLLLRVLALSPSVRLAPLNNDWLKGLLEREPKTLPHILVGEKSDDMRVVLTADTAELQQFVLKNLNATEAWQDAFELKRE